MAAKADEIQAQAESSERTPPAVSEKEQARADASHEATLERTAKADAKAAETAVAAGDPVTGYGKSAQAAKGKVVKVPKTPEEIAAQGTKLGTAGDFTTGGNAGPAGGGPVGLGGTPVVTFERNWAMDGDHTTDNRHKPDQLSPDCSTEV